MTEDAATRSGARWVSKETLLQTADVVSLHLVLSQRTHSIIGRAELDLMKSDALLVNTSRGPLVDETALLKSLADGKIAGAALDVFDEEPLAKDHPFRTLPNMIATPHIGYVTQKSYRTFYKGTVENLVARLDGVPIRTL